MKQNSICTSPPPTNQKCRRQRSVCSLGAAGPWICTFPPPTPQHPFKSSQVSQVMRSMEERCRRKRLTIVAEKTCSLLLIFHCYFLQYNAGELGEKDLSCSD